MLIPYPHTEVWDIVQRRGRLLCDITLTRHFSDDVVPVSFELPEFPKADMVRAYYAAVSFIDAQVGRVLGKLEELDLADNTAVVLWGDHGFHLGDHSRWAKHTQFENVMR